MRFRSCGFGVVAIVVGVCGQDLSCAAEQPEIAGIGVALRIQGGQVLISSVLPGTPASKANLLKPNDRILAVGEATNKPLEVKGMGITEVAGLIRGRKGTVVQLTIVPAGKTEGDARVVSITRGELKALSGLGWWEPRHVARSPSDVVQMLVKHGLKVQQVPASDLTVNSLAGHYTMGSGLSGRELYLFTDGSYIYTEWGDVLPETIYEKGAWRVKDGLIVAEPDDSLPRLPFPKDHVYAPLLHDQSADILLMSYRWYYSYFIDHADKTGSPDEVMLKICTMLRKARPSGPAQEEKRRELMARAWRPDFLKNEDGEELSSEIRRAEKNTKASGNGKTPQE